MGSKYAREKIDKQKVDNTGYFKWNNFKGDLVFDGTNKFCNQMNVMSYGNQHLYKKIKDYENRLNKIEIELP